MYRLKILVYDDGFRMPILVDENGVPHSLTSLLALVKLRNKLLPNSIQKHLRAVDWFFEWEK